MTDHDPTRFREAKVIQIDPAHCTPHPANRRDLAHAAEHIESLKTSIREAGQLVPAMLLAVDGSDKLLIVFGACRAAAIHQLRLEGHDAFLSAIVIAGVASLGDLMIAAEQTRTRDWSQWERSELFDRLAANMSNIQIAKQLDLAKSTVGRTRNVTALPWQFLELVSDKHMIEAEPARLFNRAWNTPKQSILARHLAELLVSGEKFDAPALFDSCAQALAIAEGSDIEVADGAAEAVTAAFDNLRSVIREGDTGDDEDATSNDHHAAGNDDVSERRATKVERKLERKLEAGPGVVDIVLDEYGDIIGEAKRTATGALIITVEGVDQYPLDSVSAAIMAALERLFII